MVRCLWIILPGGEDCQLFMLAIKDDDLFRISLAEALLLLLVLKPFSNAADLISSPTHRLPLFGKLPRKIKPPITDT